MTNAFSVFARSTNRAASSPAATAMAFLLVAAWLTVGPHMHYSDFWQLIMNTLSSVITFLMVFILNNAQNRDTAAMNSKLDALILALEAADNRLIGLEQQPAVDAEAIQTEIRELGSLAVDAEQLRNAEH